MFCWFINGACVVYDSIESAVNDYFLEELEIPVGEASVIEDEEVVSTFFGDLQ